MSHMDAKYTADLASPWRAADHSMMCEAHPGRAWPHGDCPGPGMPWIIEGRTLIEETIGDTGRPAPLDDLVKRLREHAAQEDPGNYDQSEAPPDITWRELWALSKLLSEAADTLAALRCPAPPDRLTIEEVEQRAIEAFVTRVNARAEAEMLAGRPVTGAHHRAIDIELRDVLAVIAEVQRTEPLRASQTTETP